MNDDSEEVVAASPNPLQIWSGRSWCALHTRARHEKKVAAVCEGMGVPHYLPLRKNHTFSGGKRNTFLLPIFPGYVFAALSPGDLAKLKRTNSVVQRLDPINDEDFVQSLDNIRRVLDAGADVDIVHLKPGRHVRVIEGPLAGLTGYIIRHKNRQRLQVQVETIHRAILVDIAPELLGPY